MNLALNPDEKQELLALLEEKERREERHRARTDLAYLLIDVLGRKDMDRAWLRARCREVEENRDDFLDLWAREHYKSTIITFGLTIMEILGSHGDDPLPRYEGRELCFGLFSHTRPIAKSFLRQIKEEFEGNRRLQRLFPDVLWSDPKKQAPKWSEDDGIIVKRKSNPKEATVEAWGVVDGQPTGKHFPRLVYDDVVTKESVTNPDMIAKTTESLALSYNLGAHGGTKRFVGTRYHFNDTYRTVIDRGTVQVRIYPATVDGSPDGQPVLLDPEALAQKRRDMGSYVFGCQMLQNPRSDETQGFQEPWLRRYDQMQPKGLNTYILADPAHSKKKSSDFTVMWVVGLGPDENYYLLDGLRDRLNLTERAARLIDLHRKWKPKQVRYEQYGLQADIEHIKTQQAAENYRFDILEVGGHTNKLDRIRRLIPLFEAGRIYLPRTMHRTNYQGQVEDLMEIFINQEFKAFPVPLHDDMLDALARIAEPTLQLSWPKSGPKRDLADLMNQPSDY